MLKLGVNIDHVATLRQARMEAFPDPVKAAAVCERAGADSIVCHLRKDRRHIQDKDLVRLRKSIRTKLNLEMSTNEEIVKIALKVRPDQATLVPEKRQELTTEGGLDVARHKSRISAVIRMLNDRGIVASLFIDAKKSQVEASKKAGAQYVELHTGRYANTKSAAYKRREELEKVRSSALFADKIGLGVNAGHGLDYTNAGEIARISVVQELNIGFSIISESVFTGLDNAVKMMRMIMDKARR